MLRRQPDVLACILLAALLLAGCGAEARPEVRVETLFTDLPPAYTGVRFENRLAATEAFNVFTYRNYFNGGGVGIGDLDGDGRRDLYLTGNQRPNRLYLNRGGFRFEDVTEAAGVAGARPWSTGVALADVNGDGRLDVYVCNAGLEDRANELFINLGPDADGTPRFEDRAAAYGLDDEGYTTHAAFFDYDRDGDLDAYLLNNSPRPVSSFGLRNTRRVRDPLGGDKLLRNDGPPEAPRFTDVSAEAGIYGAEIAFGLGVSVGDVNGDGWPDVYVSNDFFERDYLYVNNGDGTFTDRLEAAMPTISLSSMGADLADVDNDARPEIYVTDMLPEDDARLKTTSAYEGWALYREKLRRGFHHQVMRNMLHRNNGDGTFSDVGQLAGVHATDWSWGALFADFDQDGLKDLFVSNGVLRDVIDQDFIAYFAAELERMAAARARDLDYLDLTERIPSKPLPNYLFRNRDGLRFENVAAAWGLDRPGFSNGAAYGDLDDDGDLDLVVSNVDAPVSIYRNEADTLRDGRFLQVDLRGAAPNTLAVGAAVTAWHGGVPHFQEQIPTRGFQSSVDPLLTFGLGPVDRLDSLVVVWPRGRKTVLSGVATNQRIAVDESEAASGPAAARSAPGPTLFADVTGEAVYVHRENDFNDFDRTPLLPRMLSTEGPRLAVGDVNGDRLEDVFVGGAKESGGRILLQRGGGRFEATGEAVFGPDAISEDLGAAFFDADGDGDLDLYVASGGNEYGGGAPALADRLYLGDGRGAFRKAPDHLPTLFASTAAVRPADIDGDGDLDLFVGGRLMPWEYGRAPGSYLLENDGRGRFTDVTEARAPALQRAGMVTDAVWADLDGDGRADLALAGEWMPLTVLRNAGGRLEPMPGNGLERSHGLWNRLAAADLDGDGDADLIAANLGLNTRLRAADAAPLTLHVGDFDGNGFTEPLLSMTQSGRSVLMPLRHELLASLPHLAERLPTFADYAGKGVEDVFTAEERADVQTLHAYTLASVVAENRGGGTFRLRELPAEAQLAPLYALLLEDFDGDGALDLLAAGNFDGVKPDLGRMAASYGVFLRGDGAGGFTAVPPRTSGFFLRGQARDLALVPGRMPRVLAALNDDTLRVFTVNRERAASEGLRPGALP